jgi:hypothetical protein
MTSRMNASRKKDREAIAELMIATATDLGATVERRDEPRHAGFCGQSITLKFTLNGVGASMSINDLHGGETGLIHWYNAREYSPPEEGFPFGRSPPVRDFSGEFNRGVGSFHPRPHHKATSSGGWQWLQLCLDTGLRLARDGGAFNEERN